MKADFINDINFKSTVDAYRQRNLDKQETLVRERGNDLLHQFNAQSFLEEFKHEENPKLDSQSVHLVNVEFSHEQFDTLAAAMELVAVSGKFNPAELFTGQTNEGERNFLLSLLIPYCIISNSDSSVQWCLNQQKRKQVLQELIKTNRLTEILNNPLPETDIFGEMLRELLTKGKSISIGDRPKEELLALINALESVKGLDVPVPAVSDVKQQLDNNSILNGYLSLASTFVGREKEIFEINNFLYKPIKHGWDGLLLNGLGGAGKSTLLAMMASGKVSQAAATTVILDFDRPGIDPKDTVWLEEEITKQVGQQYPAFYQELKNARDENRQARGDENIGNDIPNSQFSDTARSSKSLIYGVRNCLIRSHPLNPFIIILDTLEEAFRRGLLEYLYSWLYTLPEILSPIPLKVILSGRLYGNLNLPVNVSEKIELSAFDPITAQVLLEKYGLSATVAEKIISSAVLPLRPLELKLVAKILVDNELTVDHLLKELSEECTTGTTNELFAGIIYRRVLLRIPDADIRPIACPGLILRYVTGNIITHVLQPALGLPEMNAEAANKILDKLASYTWLAYKGEMGEVWHVKDLRRSMLRIMAAKEPDKVKAIREQAIDYFAALKTEEGIAEAIYHRLMATTTKEQADAFDLKELGNAAKYISSDLPDLPKAAAVLLQFAIDSKIDTADLELLPDRYFALAYESAGRKLVGDRQFLAAYKLFQRASQLGIVLRGNGTRFLDKWEQEMLFATGEWEKINMLSYYQKIAERPNIYSVVNYLFPSVVVSLDHINNQKLEEILGVASMEVMTTLNILRNPDANLILSRLTYSFTVIKYYIGISEKAHYFLAKLHDNILVSTKQPPNGKNLNAIKMLLEAEEKGMSFGWHVSSIKIDAGWLTNLKRYAPVQFHPLIDSTIQKINSGSSINMLLSSLDADKATRDEWGNINIPASILTKEEMLELTSGPMPILRDPCRFAVAEAFKDPASFDSLATIIASVLPFKVTDCSPENFRQKMERNMPDALEPFIEIIDRAWVMGDFLKAAREVFPDEHKLRIVANAYELEGNSYKKLVLEDPQ
jgi:GTPase SAR1 family protein